MQKKKQAQNKKGREEQPGFFKKYRLQAGAALVLLLVAAALVFYLSRPRVLWYVDEEYTAAWNRILSRGSPSFTRREVLTRRGNPPAGRFGYLITRQGPPGQPVEGAPVRLYRDLARTLEYQGYMVLALDPWMILRRHQNPEPRREWIDSPGVVAGTMLLPGANPEAVRAWQSQLLQEQPGVFVAGLPRWEEAGRSLLRNGRFQDGAFSYTWVQIWPLLLRDEPAWLYAPISRARALPPYRMGLLDATRFPEPSDWTEYGLEADLLWALPFGPEAQLKKLKGSDAWLRDPKTQTIIANEIEWIPAHPSGTPFNTITWEAQIAWLRSSFIWQGVEHAQKSDS
jgi:hypothetical protein